MSNLVEQICDLIRKTDHTITIGILRNTHTSHLVPSMGPIVSVITLHGRQN